MKRTSVQDGEADVQDILLKLSPERLCLEARALLYSRASHHAYPVDPLCRAGEFACCYSGKFNLNHVPPYSGTSPPLPTVKFVVNKPATSRPPAHLFHLNDFVKDV